MWVGIRRWPRLKPVSVLEVAEAKLDTAKRRERNEQSKVFDEESQSAPLLFMTQGGVDFILGGERWPTNEGAREGRILGEGLSECEVEASGLRLMEAARKARGEKASFERRFWRFASASSWAT